MRLYLFLVGLFVESANSSSLNLLELSSVLHLQCTILMPECQLPTLVEKKGMVKVRNNIQIHEDTTAGFICSKSASNRVEIWNSGRQFRDYIINVNSPSTLKNYVNDFLTRITTRPPKTFDHSTMLLVINDFILLALALRESEKTSDEEASEMVLLVIKVLMELRACKLMPSLPIPSFVEFKEFPSKPIPFRPFKQSATPLGILCAIRMVRICEESSIGSKFDTTSILQFVVQEYKVFHYLSPWMKYNNLGNESWIKTYLAKRISVVERLAFLSSVPHGVGLLPLLLLDENKSQRMTLLYNSLLALDQIAFQVNYVTMGKTSEKSILLQYLRQTGDEDGIQLFTEAYMELWKELVKLGLSDVLHFQRDSDFREQVVAKIRIARIYYLLEQKEDGEKLIALDKLQALL